MAGRQAALKKLEASALAGREWCALTAAATTFAKRLKTLTTSGRKRKPVALEHVTSAAHPFMVSTVLVALADKPRRVWVITKDLKAQESISHDLATWWAAPIFFPEREELNIEGGGLPDEESHAERLALLQSLHAAPTSVEVIVLNAVSLDELVPRPRALHAQAMALRVDSQHDLQALATQLDAAGYERVPQAAERGQYSIRGGIFDVYPWQAALPIRAEFFDTTIESLRRYDPDSQISTEKINETTILLTSGDDAAEAEHGLLSECIAPEDCVIAVDLETCARANVWITTGTMPQEGVEAEAAPENFDTACHPEPIGTFEAGDFIVQEGKRRAFTDQLSEWRAQAWRVVMFFNNEGEIERFRELLREDKVDPALLEMRLGQLTGGFAIPSARLAVLCDAEVFGRYQQSRARRLITAQRRQRARKAPLDLSDLENGDCVVHQEYGIGKFRGLMNKANLAGVDEDVVVIEYADQAKLYVPLPQAWLITRYVGLGKKSPVLSTLGDGKWVKVRKQTERNIYEYAETLLQVQAERATGGGWECPPDNKWQREFEESFLYRETPDQLKAIVESKTDMESPRPMDRLICGDVGFGKTEVAIRAAFKSVMGGRQVAMLAPTTVLSQQHYHNLKERFSDYPVRVEVLNRFRTAAESRDILAALLRGDVDVLVGTHRLISKDVQFKHLGLAIVDEEQRFGVKHKERFKELFRSVDVLTLSATPIPRTLYMALMGARDMSTIDTPPLNRTPVETIICGYDERVIKKAIERELKRRGQVFFLHNRVGNIERIAEKIRSLSPPDTKVGVGHGQMPEDQLEDVMQQFVTGQIDVLVCTTIIESGIDIPNANTIIIDRADLFGLADLYQLRGRVGRAGHKAYAYLMIPRSEMTGGTARKRINAMKQYTALGSGFKIAMRDLEIRGAGNLLGTKQSGHIVAIGFDLYCQMLKASMARLQGKRVDSRVETTLAIDFVAFSEGEHLAHIEARLPAYIPTSYIPGATDRIPAYRQLATLSNLKELQALEKQWRDRFGRPPEPVINLLLCSQLKLQAHRSGITNLEIKDNKLMLRRKNDYIMIGGKFPRLHHSSSLVEKLQQALTLVEDLR